MMFVIRPENRAWPAPALAPSGTGRDAEQDR